MPKSILNQIIAEHMRDPGLVGSVACHLRRDAPVAQQHQDGRELKVQWAEKPGGRWRCNIWADPDSENVIAQIDLHADRTVRVEAHEPVSVTIDPKLDVLVLVRYRVD